MSEILSEIGSSVVNGASEAAGAAVSWASDGVGSIIGNLFYSIFYAIGTGLCWIVSILDQMFGVMSGMTKIRYAGKPQTLLSVFVENDAVTNVYWAMALIGILMCFVFAIIAVARKAADAGDKMKQSLGDILTGLFKGILIIVCMTFIMNAVLSISDKLLTQVNYAFNHATSLGQEDSIEFNDEQYAAMARVLDTIGNYSLNPSYSSRYNLNSCYNEIRGDLQYLVQQGVFDFYYTADAQGGESWQSALQKIVNASDLNKDISMDVYNAPVANAILDCMKTMQTDYSFAPLKSFKRQYSSYGSNVPLDRMIFLLCTSRAAKNPVYNNNISLEDPLRGAYYTGAKSIYSYKDVSSDFEMGSIDYIVLYIIAFKLVWDLAVIMMDCVARIFNMVFLYLIAPPFIGVMPMDDGGKFKQWTTAFVVQCFGVFGTVVAMRVLLLFIPIVINSDLVLFDSAILNLAGKLLLILGGMSTAKRASGVITGILADNAGMQAIQAGSLGDSVRQGMDHARNRVTGYGETGGFSKNGGGIRSMFNKDQNNGSNGGGGRSAGGSISNRGARGGGRDSGPRDGGRFDGGSGGTAVRGNRDSGPSGGFASFLGAMGGGFAGGGNSGGAASRSASGGTEDTGPSIEMQDLSGASSGSVSGNSGGVQQQAGTGDEGLDWLNAAAGAMGDSDMGAVSGDSGSASGNPGSGDAGLDWLPDGDVMTAERFSAPRKAPPPPRPPASPYVKRVPEGQDPLSKMKRDNS